MLWRASGTAQENACQSGCACVQETLDCLGAAIAEARGSGTLRELLFLIRHAGNRLNMQARRPFLQCIV